jgi:hypothetical protein
MVPGYDFPGGVRGTAWRAFALDPAPAACQSIKCSGRGSGCGSGGPAGAPSEAWTRPRVRTALERGGVSPEGASSPRGRRSLAEGASSP